MPAAIVHENGRTRLTLVKAADGFLRGLRALEDGQRRKQSDVARRCEIFYGWALVGMPASPGGGE
jgi:hypothetical protein